MFDAVWGTPQYDILSGSNLQIIAEMTARVPMMHHTLHGYISEYRVAESLLHSDGITNVTKRPTRQIHGRGGDLQFTYEHHDYLVEVKTLGAMRTLRNGRYSATVSTSPTRKSPLDPIRAYRHDVFDILAVNAASLGSPAIWYARVEDLPRHKANIDYLAGSMTTSNVCGFPFTLSIYDVLLQTVRSVS